MCPLSRHLSTLNIQTFYEYDKYTDERENDTPLRSTTMSPLTACITYMVLNRSFKIIDPSWSTDLSFHENGVVVSQLGGLLQKKMQKIVDAAPAVFERGSMVFAPVVPILESQVKPLWASMIWCLCT